MLLAQAALIGPASAFRSAEPPVLVGDLPICHAGGGDDGAGAPPGQRDRGEDCALCVICHTLGAGAVLPDPAAGQPAPPVAVIDRSIFMPPARAPPGRPFLAAAYPTGPPNLA